MKQTQRAKDYPVIGELARHLPPEREIAWTTDPDRLLSDDDLDPAGMTREELDLAWDLWFDLAQSTNDFDPPYSHGVLVRLPPEERADGVASGDRDHGRSGDAC